MKVNLELFGHTIELCSSGSGSIDPWSGAYAHSINLSLWGTADIGEFMLIDGSKIYKLYSFTDAKELHDFITSDVFDSWEQFENEWLNPKIEKRRVRYEGTLEESIETMKKSKKRSEVWDSIPEKKRREVYEYLKTLTKEETEKWYEEKIKELEEK